MKIIIESDSSDLKNYLQVSVLEDILCELQSARRWNISLNSVHEAYAVILEELDEFWEEVRKKSENREKELMYKELVQVAAMCLRAIHDLSLRGK